MTGPGGGDGAGMLTALPAIDAEAADLLRQMTLEEKCDLFAGRDMWHLRGVPRLGVPDVRVTDCGHGVTPITDRPVNGTCFPTGVGQASTWNRELIEEMGCVLGEEAQALGNGVLLGPKITLHRLPIGGRNFETYSEDPVLAGRLGAALVRGIQSQGTAACVKAFVCNHQQKNQEKLDVIVDARTLHELYCTPFRLAVAEAGPLMLMTSYNRVGGNWPSGSRHLLHEVVKRGWGFRGAIVSDWRAVHGPDCIPAGLDLEMPGPGKFLRQEDVLAALRAGTIDEAEINDRARRVLRVLLFARRGRLPAPRGPDEPAHGAVARRVAEEAIVLLKNAGGVLPFDRARVKRLAVIGPNSVQARLGGGGSASVCPPYAVGPLDAIERLLGPGVEVRCAEGCPLIGALSAITSRNLRQPDGDQPGLRVEYFRNQHLQGEPFLATTSRQIDFSWGWASPVPGFQVHAFSIRWCGRLVAEKTGTHRIGGFTTGGGFRLFLDGRLAIDLWGEPNGEGKEKITRSAAVEIALTAGQPVELRFEYNKVVHSAAVRLEWQEPGESDPVQQAVELARGADAVVVCGGISNSFEGGAQDRDTMAIPGEQNRLIRAVVAANPRTAVVLFSGNPLDLSAWVDQAPAIIQAWYPGQEGGSALADILFGVVNPSGKLPDTLPRRIEDCPAWATYPGTDDRAEYREGLFAGYRHYEAHGVEPLFPFGHGLSYTTFAYADLRLSAPTVPAAGAIEVSVEVRNTGTRAGKEAVQLYVGAVASALPRPRKELKDFAKILLAPGEARRVGFTLAARDLAYWDEAAKAWRVEAGIYEVFCGGSSRQGLTARFAVSG